MYNVTKLTNYLNLNMLYKFKLLKVNKYKFFKEI